MIGIPFRYKSEAVPPAAPRKRAFFAASSLLLIAAVAAGCGDSEKRGELIVAIGTDMAMPQQIDNLYVQVQMRGLVVFDAVAILPSKEGAALLTTLPAARDFVASSAFLRGATSALASA